MSTQENDEILKEFLSESHEGLERMGAELLGLERSPSDKALISSLFRTMHTIKGSCGFLGQKKLESLSHLTESVLSALRDGKLGVDANLITLLLLAAEAARRILASIEAHGTEGHDDLSVIERALRAVSQGESLADKLGDSEKRQAQALRQRSGGGRSCSPDAPSATEGANVDLLQQKKPGMIGEILVRCGVASNEDVILALREQKRGDPRRLGEILVESGVCRPQDIKRALLSQGDTQIAAALENIQVDISLLDKLMNQVGELVLIRNQVQQFTDRFPDRAFASAAQRLNLITSELQEAVMKTRMQPIATIWSQFPRQLRHLSTVLDKEVKLETDGANTTLDRTIIEAIKDPLTHIVRNAVDHGIEAREVRLKANKPADGTITLRAFHEGGQVHIEVGDDGRGMSPDVLREKAVSIGLVSALEAARMKDREALALIFRPGFSTAVQVTNVSGRGVGMDVVKTNIERIGGSIDLQSVVGAGTTVKIKIPLTLAIIPALMVTTRGESYALPQVSLLEVVRLDALHAKKIIEFVAGAPVYRLRGELLPLVYLSNELDGVMPEPSEVVNIVVLQTGGHAFGLVVDSINDTAEIVVKPLGPQLKGIGVFAGATILGDGQVALILDVMGLAQQAHVISEGRDRIRRELADEPSAESQPLRQVLLLGVGDDRRLAIPLSSVSRLEEIPRRSLENSGGKPVVQYRGRVLPLISLASALGTSAPNHDPMQVVVYNSGGRNLGLIVDQILDIVEQPNEGSDSQTQGLTSAVIQGKVTDLLDIDAMFDGKGVTQVPELAAQRVEAAE